MDNSPRFDRPYSRVVVGAGLPPYTRADLGAVPDDSQRPSERDYDRYLWLVEELRAVGYDDAATLRSGSFRVGDVLLTAVLAVACDVMAETGATIGAPGGDVAWLRSTADALRAARHGGGRPGDRAGPRPRRADRRVARHGDHRRLRPAAVRRFGARRGARPARSVPGSAVVRAPGPVRRRAAEHQPRAPTSSTGAATGAAPIWPVLVWLFGAALARRGHRRRGRADADRGPAARRRRRQR